MLKDRWMKDRSILSKMATKFAGSEEREREIGRVKERERESFGKLRT